MFEYFIAVDKQINVNFVISGYDGAEPYVIGVGSKVGEKTRQNVDAQNTIKYSAVHMGDTIIANRLMSNIKLDFTFMSVQDAVDLSRHVIRTTKDQMRFEPVVPTVGGPIDTLVVDRYGVRFITKKTVGVSS